MPGSEEELGWRGFAQPQLQASIGASRAGLIIGLVWSLWHLPLFYFLPSAVGGLPLLFYIPLVSAFGLLFAWLYNGSGGSVLLCIVLHEPPHQTRPPPEVCRLSFSSQPAGAGQAMEIPSIGSARDVFRVGADRP